MAESQQKVIIKVPKRFNPSQRVATANEIINHIRSRTSSGLDKNDRAFKRYAKSYINDQDFKLAGKSASSVNLQFTGEMINDIELLNHGSGFIVLGFEKGSVNDKASFSKEKGREFLGISEKQKARIIKRIDRSSVPEVEEIVEVPTLTQRILDRLRGN